MQLGSSPPPRAAAAAPALPTAASATDRLVSRLDPGLAAVVPRAVLDTPLGGGTVASELERAIRIRFDGSAEPSERTIVPETQAAVDLLASPAGSGFERAMRAIASVADGHHGADDLKSISLHPDEHTTLADEVFVELDLRHRDGERIERLDRPRRAERFVRDATDGELANLSFRAAVNAGGHISVAPDVSRELLASLELYVPKDGDMVASLTREGREDALLESWKTMVHETHHSVTPEDRYDDEAINVFEEAIPTVLEEVQAGPTAAKAGVDLAGVAARIGAGGAADARAGAVQWPAWNRDRLPAPNAESEATAEGRYTDGPLLVQQLIGLAGVDATDPRNTARIDRLLQGDRAANVPARIATVLAGMHGLDQRQTRQLLELIRDAAVGDATIEDVTSMLRDPGR